MVSVMMSRKGVSLKTQFVRVETADQVVLHGAYYDGDNRLPFSLC